MNITIGAEYTISFNGAPMYLGAFYSTTATGGMFRGIDARTGAAVDTGIAWECPGRTITPN
jgi:hypothetical protein